MVFIRDIIYKARQSAAKLTKPMIKKFILRRPADHE